MDNPLTVYEIKRVFTKRWSKNGGLDNMKQRIMTEMFLRRIDRIAKIDADHLAVFASRYVIRDTANANSHLQNELVSNWSRVKIHDEPHGPIHVFGSQVPVGFGIPVIADPFFGEGAEDILFARSRLLVRKSETW